MRKNLLILFSWLMGMLFIFPQPSWALILHERPIEMGFGYWLDDGQPNISSDKYSYRMGYIDGPRAFDLNLTSSNTGDVFTFSPADSEFTSFVDYLTNGTAEQVEDEILGPTTLGLSDQFGIGGNYRESDYFGPSPYPNNGIDLQGYTITSLQFYVDDFSETVKPAEIGLDQRGVNYKARLRVNGEPGQPVIPEPATMLLFSTGILGAFVQRRLANRSRPF